MTGISDTRACLAGQVADAPIDHQTGPTFKGRPTLAIEAIAPVYSPAEVGYLAGATVLQRRINGSCKLPDRRKMLSLEKLVGKLD